MANTEQATLIHRIRSLMRTRSVDMTEVGQRAGAATGILDDMTVEQLRKVLETIEQLAQVKRGKEAKEYGD